MPPLEKGCVAAVTHAREGWRYSRAPAAGMLQSRTGCTLTPHENYR
ncbi:hypothetical protein HMPREF0293_2013 [Corynebacterium glucuronolyticum ATCC 51866]|uniref:Uncharacterized protein n=1 Tax=Corynebacterium glucuronolyticum ATCC 51866 TaxID=548478 RepID=A0ABM9XN10_9CORY|nr:hypothetical protein HMPREF0293_2013 [Corynebacterium glucuronolyticum ATCC 51866]